MVVDYFVGNGEDLSSERVVQQTVTAWLVHVLLYCYLHQNFGEIPPVSLFIICFYYYRQQFHIDGGSFILYQ